jgi:hypothetical protein
LGTAQRSVLPIPLDESLSFIDIWVVDNVEIGFSLKRHRAGKSPAKNNFKLYVYPDWQIPNPRSQILLRLQKG